MESTTEDVSTLAPELAHKLNALTPGSYCFHRSWGFGKITESDAEAEQLIIDFKSKKGHALDFEFAAQSLTPLAHDHILVQKTENLSGLKEQAEKDPVAIVRIVINSLGSGATTDAIQASLSPDVVAVADWKKWWEGAKRALKKDGHYFIPTKKVDTFQILSAPSALGDQALDKFRAAIGGKAQLATLPGVIKAWPEIKSEAVAAEVDGLLSGTLAKLPKSQLGLSVELALGRDEFAKEAGLPPATGTLATLGYLPTSAASLNRLLEEIPSVKQAKVLGVLQQGLPPEEWSKLFLGLLPKATARVAETISDIFADAGREAEVVSAINRLIRERSVTCDFLVWLCKNRPKGLENLIEPQLFMAILSVLEKDQLADYKKGTKLTELVLGDKELVSDILKNAPFEDVRDITRAILLSPVFEELDRRSLLATIIKLYPDVQAMVVGGERKEVSDTATTLIVSWESLTRRQAELEEIVSKKIPENIKEIEIARSYGDLRENHEFKAAKEMQTVLARRRAELEQMLLRSQGTDFADVDASEVRIGTLVTVKDTATSELVSYTILGAWDSDPTQGVISYLTALAKNLLGHKVGENVSLQTETGEVRPVVIEKIESYKK